MDYSKISKDSINYLYGAYKSLQQSPLPADLRALIELRVSQINSCSYCCNLHANEALKLGVSQSKIDNLQDFVVSGVFSDAEIEALKWAESLTKLNENKKVETTKLSKYFNEREIVDMTICISLMNTFNRLAISMKP